MLKGAHFSWGGAEGAAPGGVGLKTLYQPLPPLPHVRRSDRTGPAGPASRMKEFPSLPDR